MGPSVAPLCLESGIRRSLGIQLVTLTIGCNSEAVMC